MISSVVSMATMCISTTSRLSALRPSSSTRFCVLLTKPGRATFRNLELKPAQTGHCHNVDAGKQVDQQMASYAYKLQAEPETATDIHPTL
jgi:hypothetical protein